MREPLSDLDLRAMWHRLRMVGNFDALCPSARHAFECTANVWRDRELGPELPDVDGKRRAANNFD
ncbi:hypothetical protein [Burkholderia gladioli]|uniref:hypothetical protein n=1 Tax=Burkholderia gladioli TaxID=28095 RepID=UPI000CFFD827|nr:hypothetical protein [Burkholderia gladioli]PRE89294.1 hypothetical protein C6Q13_08105 [Burkholderia gladioli]